jgi:succinoglycan biosynthesis transport protein ExoP
MTFIDFDSILSRRSGWSLAVMLGMLAAVGYIQWQARIIPLYAAVTTVQLEPAVAAGTAVPAASPTQIKTFRQIMVSNRFRSQVAASLTPAERRVVLRPALKRHLNWQAPLTVANALGSVDPEPVGNSAQIRVRVTHEDPEAAALIANRYVEEFQTLLAQDPDAIGSSGPDKDGLLFHRLDVATPNYAAHSPNLRLIKRSSIGVALFACGLGAAMLSLVAAWRKAGEMRSI